MGARCAVESPPPLNTKTPDDTQEKTPPPVDDTLNEEDNDEEKESPPAEEEGQEAEEIPEKKRESEIPDIKREDSYDQALAVPDDVGSESSTLPLICTDSNVHSDSQNKDGSGGGGEGSGGGGEGEGVEDPIPSAAEVQLQPATPVTPISDITTVTRLTVQTPLPGAGSRRDSQVSGGSVVTGGGGEASGDKLHVTLEQENNTTNHTMENFVIAMSQLKLTKPAPEWRGTSVFKGEFKDISLSDYRGKYLVFFFYPLDFTFVCPTEIIAFSERVEEFRSIGCEVVACSTDSHFSHLAWVNTPRKQGGLGEMKIPLLADKTCEIAKAYGVLKEDEGIAFRGLFIVDDKGNLRQITINDLPVGRSVDETLRLVQAFQFTDKHGEVCPAGWKPGKATMKPDPKNSKTYFADNH